MAPSFVEQAADPFDVPHRNAGLQGPRGAPALSVTVVPDTGTEQLQGLRGSLAIRIEDGKHYYDFTYDIVETQ